MQVENQIIFDHIMLNQGSHYNPGTGNFIVPIKGVYAFFLTATRSSTSSEFHIAIRKNGQKIGQSTVWAAGVPSTSLGTAITSCEVGDVINTVVVYVGSGSPELLAGRHSTFCGALMHTE
jgi:hypothetical protein